MWSDQDLAWLAEAYPGLRQTASDIIEGRLSYQMLHLNGRHIIRPRAEDLAAAGSRGTYLCDTYEIRLKADGEAVCPLTQETGGRLDAVANRLGLLPIDLHVFENKKKEKWLCLASGPELIDTFAKTFSLQVYIEELLIPYLFAQTYFATYQRWPWGELSHGHIGILEWLGRKDNPVQRDAALTVRFLEQTIGRYKTLELIAARARAHKPCICGSGRQTRLCHSDAQKGIARIRSEMTRRNLLDI